MARVAADAVEEGEEEGEEEAEEEVSGAEFESEGGACGRAEFFFLKNAFYKSCVQQVGGRGLSHAGCQWRAGCQCCSRSAGICGTAGRPGLRVGSRRPGPGAQGEDREPGKRTKVHPAPTNMTLVLPPPADIAEEASEEGDAVVDM